EFGGPRSSTGGGSWGTNAIVVAKRRCAARSYSAVATGTSLWIPAGDHGAGVPLMRSPRTSRGHIAIGWLDDGAQDFAEADRKALRHLEQIEPAPEQRREGSHTGRVNPARHDEIEIPQVGVDVERDAVRRDPARHPHADGGHLGFSPTR